MTSPAFGRQMRPLWMLQEDAAFLNHGSYGACPRPVLEAQRAVQRQMEAQPDIFFHDQVMPYRPDTPLRQAAATLGAFIGAPAGSLAFVENATAGVEAALYAAPLKAGDEILISDHQYNAVRLAVERRCRQTGAVVRTVRIPIPTTPEETAARFGAAASSKVRLAIVDHITSATALIFPVEAIVAALHAQGIPVLIDGAHAIGQIPLDLSRLGAEWHVTNAHKWLYAPRACALLYASDSVASATRPSVTSHFVEDGFTQAFDYVGTRDYSSWLAAPAALAFLRTLGPEALWAYERRLIAHASDLLEKLGARPVGPPEMSAAMRSFILPQTREARVEDAIALRRAFWEEERMQIKAELFHGVLLLRVSAQAYVDEEDITRMAAALKQRSWPGR